MPARECSRCGCQGHGQTYAVTCTRCRKPKFPTLLQAPDPQTYVCVLCLAGGSDARREAGRAVAAQKSRLRKLAEATGPHRAALAALPVAQP
jgi:hypothetical protein